MSREEHMKKIKEARAMTEAGQIAYEVIGSRRKNEEELHRGNYYHWKIKLVCALCKHVQKDERRVGWMGQKDYLTDNRLCCESCGEWLVIRKHTDMWVREAKQGNVLARDALKHYPR